MTETIVKTIADKKEKIKIPTHVAIIMDGNRRWAQNRGKPSKYGHAEGYKRLKEISSYCKKIGIKILTVYALSSDNLKKRSKEELKALFYLIKKGLKEEGERMIAENIKMNFIGRKEGLPKDLIRDINAMEEKTRENTEGIFNVALNYGGREEIVDAIKRIIEKKIDIKNLTEDIVTENLYTSNQVEPELVIRTGGHTRMSNFLPWQTIYSDYYFTKVLWPDFTVEEFKKALDFYRKVQRNFGA